MWRFGLRVKVPPVQCPPVYHTRWRLQAVPFIAIYQAGKLSILIFLVFCSTCPGMELKSIVPVAEALSTRQLIADILLYFAVV